MLSMVNQKKRDEKDASRLARTYPGLHLKYPKIAGKRGRSRAFKKGLANLVGPKQKIFCTVIILHGTVSSLKYRTCK